MKSRQHASLALALLLIGNSGAFAGVAKERNPPIDERALKGSGPTIAGPSVTPEDSVNYNGTITGAPTWTRPFADCTGATGLGPMEFSVQQFSVLANGSYDVSSVQNGWDGYIFVYQTAFDPINPNTNCVVGNDDGNGGIGTSDIVGVALVAGTQYFVVTTAFDVGGWADWERARNAAVADPAVGEWIAFRRTVMRHGHRRFVAPMVR